MSGGLRPVPGFEGPQPVSDIGHGAMPAARWANVRPIIASLLPKGLVDIGVSPEIALQVQTARESVR